MKSQLPASILAIANLPATSVTDHHVASCIGIFLTDPRVSKAEHAGRDTEGRAFVNLTATDTREGDVNGTFTLGRCIGMLTETQSDYLTRSPARERTPAKPSNRPFFDNESERKRYNLRVLNEMGINPNTVVRIANDIARGIYVDDEDQEIFGRYCDNVAPDRHSLFQVDRHFP